MVGAGATVQVVIVSDGGLGGDAVAREGESLTAAKALAGRHRPPELTFWRLQDRGLASTRDLVGRLENLIGRAAADVVLLPSPFEVHPDHRALCHAGLRAMQTVGGRSELLCYEVGQPLMPNLLVDITPQVDRKRAALRCFPSQLAQQSYDEQLLGLNRYRAYTLGPGVTHAEAYMRVSPHDLQAGLPALLATLDRRLRSRFGPYLAN